MAWVKPTTTVEAALSGHLYDVILADTPAGYWRLGEISGTVASDSSGNARHGTYTNTPTLNQAGCLGPFSDRSCSFNGTNEYVDCGDVAAFEFTGAFAVSFWMYGATATGSEQRVIGKTDVSAGWCVNVSTGGKIRFFGRNSAGTGDAFNFLSATSVTGNTWFHVLCSWDGTANANGAVIYINGVSDATVTSADSALITSGTAAFCIGANVGGSSPYGGRLDEVAVFAANLTSAQAAEHYSPITWTDISADLTDAPIVVSYGIKNHRPEDRCATTGTIRFGLRNDPGNSGGILGYYSPYNPSRRSGWGHGVMVRVKHVEGANTRYKLGRVTEIHAIPGLYESRVVNVVAVDWMDSAARADSPVTLQVGQRSDVIAGAIIDAVPSSPYARDLDVGADTYAYALDNVSQKTRALTLLADLSRSELGYSYVRRDTTMGETFVFEARSTRQSLSTVLVTLDDTMHELDVPGSRADILNRIRVVTYPRSVSTGIVVASLQAAMATAIAAGEAITVWLDYTDPTQRDTRIGATNGIAPVATTDYTMNAAADGTGSNLTANFTVVATFFASSVKMVITNGGGTAGFVRTLQARGDGLIAYNPVTVEARDADSIRLYGDSLAEVDMKYQSDPNVGSATADYMLSLYQDPFANVRVVRFVANQSAALLTAAVTGEIGDRILLEETVAGLSGQAYIINAVELESRDQEVLVCSWWLSPAGDTDYWLLGTAGRGELDSATVLGYV